MLKVLLPLLLWLWILLGQTSTTATLFNCTTFPTAEYNALYDLYTQTNGAYWDWESPVHAWNFTNPPQNPCLAAWEGLTCIQTISTNTTTTITTTSQTTCHIQKLVLHEHNLVGMLPSSFFALTELTMVDLVDNRLFGGLPRTWDQLRHLQILNLALNQFTGTIPTTFANMITLTEMDINSNQIHGAFPDFWHADMQLTQLYLYNNMLTGTIPINITTLSHLDRLDFSQNLLHGSLLPEFILFTNLTSLVITYNQLTGTLPAVYGQHFKKLSQLEFNFNQLNGSIPETWCYFPKLTNLGLSHNSLTGRIPYNISQLVELNYLYLSVNLFHHRIPESLGLMPTLRSVVLENNSFTGTIPEVLKHCPLLYNLNFNYNLLTGSIPNIFSSLPKLSNFQANTNFLTSTLPKEIFEVPALSYLGVNENLLTGTIPKEAASCARLSQVYFRGNAFTGTIPAHMLNLPKLQAFLVDSNQLAGPLPGLNVSAPFNVYGFRALSLSINYFTGTISPSFGNFRGLYILLINDNLVHGTIPDTLRAHNMIGLFLGSNMLTGSIPASLSQAIKLQEVYFYSNFLTGTVPWTSFSASNLTVLNVAENQLHGSIAENIGSFRNLIELNLSSNHMTGSLPASFQQLHNALVVDLSNNAFTGDLHSRFDQMANLTTLLLQNNAFGGNLLGDSFLQAQVNSRLTIVDVSTNQLTSTLPASLFQLPALAIVNVAKNCMAGSIPESICQSSTLTTLLLDGLHAQCEVQIFPHTSINTFRMVSRVEGGIPVCLYQMASLLTLHVSGNGIHDNLPSDIWLSPALQDLILSHNQLTGTIPSMFQERSWKTLDLSFNRLTGTLVGDLLVPSGAENEEVHFESSKPTSSAAKTSSPSSSSSLNLQVNRLSGTIPSSVQHMATINMLEGNMFACDVSRSSLPEHDPNVDSYHCGSDDVNRPLVIIAVLLLIGVATWLYFQSTPKDLAAPDITDKKNSLLAFLKKSVACLHWNIPTEDMSAEVDEIHHAISQFYTSCSQVRKAFLWITLFATLVMIPLYVVVSFLFNSYEHQYAWILSIGYVSGMTPAIIIFVTLTVFLATLVYCLVLFGREPQLGNAVTQKAESNVTWGLRNDFPRRLWTLLHTKWFGFACLISIVDVVVVMTIYMSYIYSTVQHVDVEALALISFLVSIFKLVWNVRFLMQYARGLLEHHKQELDVFFSAEYLSNESKAAKSRTFQNEFILCMMIFNNILAPVLSVLFISPNCFYYILVSSPLVTSSYHFLHCYTYNLVIVGVVPDKLTCSIYGTDAHTTTYHPSYSYNYQCSSSLLSGFVDIFLYRYLLSTLSPLLMLAMKYLQERFQQRGNIVAANRLLYILPLILQPSNEVLMTETIGNDGEEKENNQIGEVYSSTSNPLSSDLVSSDGVENSTTNANSTTKQEDGTLPQSWWNRFHKEDFSKDSFVILLLGDVAVLLTFGMLFPPIAVILCLSIYVQTWYHQYSVGRFLSIATRNNQDTALRARMLVMIGEISGLVNAMNPSLFSLLLIAGSTWAFFLYDMLGDEVGGRSAVGLLVVTCAMPFLLWAATCALFHLRILRSTSILSANVDQAVKDNNIELKSLT